MKNFIILTAVLILSAALQQEICCQTDCAVMQYGNKMTLTCLQENSLKDINPDTKEQKSTEWGKENISLSDLKSNLLNMPGESETKHKKRLSENEYSSDNKNYTASVLIGSGVGLACGIIADILYYSYKSYGDKKSPQNFGELFTFLAPEPVPSAPLILIPVGTTLFGALIGAAVAPEEHPSYELYGRNAGKRKTNDSNSIKNTVSGL